MLPSRSANDICEIPMEPGTYLARSSGLPVEPFRQTDLGCAFLFDRMGCDGATSPDCRAHSRALIRNTETRTKGLSRQPRHMAGPGITQQFWDQNLTERFKTLHIHALPRAIPSQRSLGALTLDATHPALPRHITRSRLMISSSRVLRNDKAAYCLIKPTFCSAQPGYRNVSGPACFAPRWPIQTVPLVMYRLHLAPSRPLPKHKVLGSRRCVQPAHDDARLPIQYLARQDES